MRLPEPDAYAAFAPGAPVSRRSIGSPVTVTRSEKFTAISTVLPAVMLPSGVCAHTDSTRGGTLSFSYILTPLKSATYTRTSPVRLSGGPSATPYGPLSCHECGPREPNSSTIRPELF